MWTILLHQWYQLAIWYHYCMSSNAVHQQEDLMIWLWLSVILSYAIMFTAGGSGITKFIANTYHISNLYRNEIKHITLLHTYFDITENKYHSNYSRSIASKQTPRNYDANAAHQASRLGLGTVISRHVWVPYWEATWRKRTVVRGFVATILAEFDDELHLFCWTCCQLLKTPSRTPRGWQAIRWCNWRRRHCKFSQAQSNDKSQPSEKKTRWSWNLWNLNQTVANRKPRTTLTTEMLNSFHGR